MAHLATGKPAPAEWIEFTLLDRFKWTPDELRAVSLADGLRLLTMMGAQSKVEQSRHTER